MNYKMEVNEKTFEILVDESTDAICCGYFGFNNGIYIMGIIADSREKCLEIFNNILINKVKHCQKTLDYLRTV